MNFLAPAVLLGLLGVALPVVAHLLGREAPRVIPFAGMRFLQATDQAVTHRRQVRDWPLLLIRALLLALLVFALARPVGEQREELAVYGEPHDAVLLLDGSRSMGLRVDEATLLEHARGRLETILEALPPGSRVGLVTSDPGGPVIPLSAAEEPIRAALEAYLGSGAPRAGDWSMAQALPAANRLFDTQQADRRRIIYAVGDATTGGLASLPERGENGANIIAIPAIDPERERPSHVSIDHIAWEPAPDLDPRAVRVFAELRHHPSSRADAVADEDPSVVDVVLRVADAEVARASVTLAPGEARSVEFTHTLLDAEGPIEATIALVANDDALRSDDARHLWLDADDALELLVVNGDPSELRAHDEAFFLSTAVTASSGGREVRLRSMAPDQLVSGLRDGGGDVLAEVDVLVLANVRAPDPGVARAIVERVREGMGLLITMGDRVSPDAYNREFDAVLPLRLREAVKLGTLPGRSEGRAEGFAPADLTHPLFARLGGQLGLVASHARRVMLLEPAPDRPHRVALALASGAPILVTREVEQGRAALLTTSIDRDWTDLPIRPGFVALTAATIEYLGGLSSALRRSDVPVGQTKTLSADAPILLRDPTGREHSIAPNDDGAIVLDDLFIPGHYRATTSGEPAVFAVNVTPEESNTSWREANVEGEDTEIQQVAITTPRWRWLVLLGLVLLALESLWRARPRAGWRRRR